MATSSGSLMSTEAAVGGPPGRNGGHTWIPAVAFALVGAALLVWLVQRTDGAELWRALQRGAAWAPLLVGIEGARIAIEAWGGQKLYAKPIRYPLLLRATLVAYAISALAPAGRATGEGVKAGMLRKRTGLSDTAAAATTLQMCSLLALGLWSLLCTVVALGVSLPLAGTFALQTAVVFLGVALVRGVSRASGFGRFVGRFWPTAARKLDAVRARARAQSVGRPLFGFVLSRGLELVQYAIIFVGITGRLPIVPVILSFGVATVAGTVGDSVPVQLGVIGASFTAASSVLGISRAEAVAFGALAHTWQIAWTSIGLLTPVVWRIRAPTTTSSRE